MDYILAAMPKPYIAIMDGITSKLFRNKHMFISWRLWECQWAEELA